MTRGWILLLVFGVAVLASGCVTRRTVSEGGRTVEEKYVIKRPIKEALDKKR